MGHSFTADIIRAMRMLVVEDEQKLAQLVKRALTIERFSVDVGINASIQ